MKKIIILLAPLLCMAAVQAQDPPKRIDIVLDNFKFVPSQVTLQHGQSYVLHFSNASSGGHDFVAKEFFAAAQIDPGDATRVKGGEVELGGGQSVDIRLTAPAQAGASYKVHCSHFMHSNFGMTGDIVVN